MNRRQFRSFRSWALSGVAVAAIASPAWAQDARRFEIPQQSLIAALEAFGKQGDAEILFSRAAAEGRATSGVVGDYEPAQALSMLLDGSGLKYRQVNANTYVVEAQAPQGGSAAGGGAEVEALIVTAQKREEDIQDVPIAISAFTQESLERSQIAGGPDLITQVPNMTFTKTNFASYSIQIRGIGTQAISATTDPAVAVAFNNTPFVRNRFFEQEFYDLARVEVLRGPQGTLYGRNATAGVVNIISAKPKFSYEAKASADVANYGSMRLEGMLNIPLIEDVAALRVAGAWTKRDGYVTNEITGNPIDGRDLWSTRVSLRFEPTDRISADLIWEHFEEDDDRLRSGKQLCKKDPSKTSLGGVNFPNEAFPGQNGSPLGTYNQGCIPASFYAPESFQTPNGFALPYYHPLSQINLPTVQGLDPYLSTVQSRDLRVIESTVDPAYRARTDTVELQMSFDIGDNLTLASETAYSLDTLFSTQDYNRFNTAPGAFDYNRFYNRANAREGVLDTNGVFCDPQIGCADRLVLVDLSTADSRHLSQELRLSSDYDGPFNFSLGANFLRYDTEDKYYVFINSLSMFVAAAQFLASVPVADGPYVAGVSDNSECIENPLQGDPNIVHSISTCIYMDPNPIGSLNDQGHNYFLSRNPYRLISYALFGEAYYNITDNLKVTGGLRWTVDKKRAPQIPSWLLAANTVGYPVKDIVDAEWREPTGRLAIDWKPDLAFTDETLVYGSYARGYKAGGANPPPMVVVASQVDREGAVESVLHPKTFDAEYVDAFEVGAKNTLLDGRVTLNLAAFYYDYKGYQISQIIDRTAVNSNYDAEVWGLELEADWRPTESLRFGLKLGYEDTKVADGERSIDVMDRANGGLPDENGVSWVVAKPFPSLPSNCVLPVSVVTFGGQINTQKISPSLADVGHCVRAYILGLDPITGLEYEPDPTHFLGSDGNPALLSAFWNDYPGFDPASAPNGGEGLFKDLSGNELPNAPHYTATLTADYAVPLSGDWLLNLHADLYYQSEAWTRIFNMEGYDKLKAYTNVNLAATFTSEDAGWKVMAYVKNVMDRDSITGAFLNSDDSGLTTNVFLTEPRLYGLRVTKAFSDIPMPGGLFGERRDRSTYPFTVELGGGPSRVQQDATVLAPDWLSIYRPSGGFPLHSQDTPLDMADEREIRLTYAPERLRGWRVSAGVRYGRASADAFAQDIEFEPDVSYYLFGSLVNTVRGPRNWGSSDLTDVEEYVLAEFQVGREVGLGAWGEGASSVLSAGIRYAQLDSKSDVRLRSAPDRQFPDGVDASKYIRHWHDYDLELEAERSFEGVGPVVSWEASTPLLGGQESGHIGLDWSVSGGMLFGKQKADVRMRETEGYTTGAAFPSPPTIPGRTRTTTLTVDPPRQESRSVQVPTLGASLGLSYAVDWIRLGAGYRWERYFDAIDGGIGERQEFDRTIDGPYFKISVGFGGG